MITGNPDRQTDRFLLNKRSRSCPEIQPIIATLALRLCNPSLQITPGCLNYKTLHDLWFIRCCIFARISLANIRKLQPF